MYSFVLFIFCSLALFSNEHFLTFIIPCYNCDRWVEQTVDSIYAQTNLACPFEIVCTDDGSTDRTYEVLQELARKHPEMRLFQHSVNQGGSAARNTCVRNGIGDLIFCIDSDNVLAPDSVQLLIDWMDQTGSDVVSFGGLRYFSTPLEKLSEVVYQANEGQFHLRDLLENANSPPCSGNYLYTRKSFENAGGYVVGNVFDTYVFGFLQVLHGSKLTYVPGTYYWHRVNVNGYFERESRVGRLEVHFLQFLLDHKELFTDETVSMLQTHLKRAMNGTTNCDLICLLHHKKIHLKEPLR